MNKYHFYDTSSLLAKSDLPLMTYETIVTSTTVLEELEAIKSSARHSEEVKQKARNIIRFFYQYPTLCQIICFTDDMLQPIYDKGFKTITPDLKILAAAIWFDSNEAPDNTIFFTNDLSLANIANLFFGADSILSIDTEAADYYKGYSTVRMTDEQLAQFYENPTIMIEGANHYVNEYLFIENSKGELVDTVCWTGSKYRPLVYGSFDSQYFGTIKPMKNDKYQRCAFDSLKNNQITMLKGAPGSGKSLLGLSYLFSELDKGAIDQIIIFCNTVATKNAAKLGYYAGSRDEKLMDSQIGNFLGCKLGSKMMVNHLIDTEKLLLLPMSDVRGYDTSGRKAGVYITEAQNMDISLMKLALQRVGEDCKVVIDGDCDTQVDLQAFSGSNNGMRRLSEVFRGEDIYGEVTLDKIHRSRIAAIAQKM